MEGKGVQEEEKRQGDAISPEEVKVTDWFENKGLALLVHIDKLDVELLLECLIF
ncbi:hypothetical protein PVAP13_8KG136400 [Panicum virgatum]|uniref:Uncharacterized protein n=1 Tax=Panicum virgatum TaxID=38727 RepID=A0A8T0PFZ9_PANVG|nr:hypothetical protein PVAP13_8KG136400 [Panicum virgatum]